jgi:hypothetical protein
MANDPDWHDSGRQALAAIDEVLANQPRKEGHGFSAAMRCLCACRDRLVAIQRRDGATPASQARLAQVNGIISIVLAGHFPLDHIPWADIRVARDSLANLLAAAQGCEPGFAQDI